MGTPTERGVKWDLKVRKTGVSDLPAPSPSPSPLVWFRPPCSFPCPPHHWFGTDLPAPSPPPPSPLVWLSNKCKCDVSLCYSETAISSLTFYITYFFAVTHKPADIQHASTNVSVQASGAATKSGQVNRTWWCSEVCDTMPYTTWLLVLQWCTAELWCFSYHDMNIHIWAIFSTVQM